MLRLFNFRCSFCSNPLDETHKLHAQEYVLPLYVKAGYTQIAPVDYEDEGQPHVWMAKRVDGR